MLKKKDYFKNLKQTNNQLLSMCHIIQVFWVVAGMLEVV
jgi:hypothetical protein